MFRNISINFPFRAANTKTSTNNNDTATQTDDDSTQGSASISDRVLANAGSANQASGSTPAVTAAPSSAISLKEAEKIMKENYIDFVFRKELKLSTLKADPPIDENHRVVSVNSESDSQSTVVTASKYNKDEKITHSVSGDSTWVKEFLDANKAYANKYDLGHQRMANEIRNKNPRPHEVFSQIKSDLGKLAENKVIATLKPEAQLKILPGPIDHFSEEIQNEIKTNAKKYQTKLDTYRKSVGKVTEDYVSHHRELQGLLDDEIQRAQDAIEAKHKNEVAEDRKTATAHGKGFSANDLKLFVPQRMSELQDDMADADVAEKPAADENGNQTLAVPQPSSSPLGFLANRRNARYAKKQAKEAQRADWEKEFNSARTTFHQQLIEKFEQSKYLQETALSELNSKHFGVLQTDIVDKRQQYQKELDDFADFIRPGFEELEIHVPKGVFKGRFRSASRKQRIKKWVDFYYGKYLINLINSEKIPTEDIRSIRDSFETKLDTISQKEDVNNQGNIDRAIRLTTSTVGTASQVKTLLK